MGQYWRIAFAIVLAYFAADSFLNRAISRPAGILITEEPTQKDLPANFPAIRFKDDLIQPLAEYSVKARVLSKERYWLDWGAKYAPYDLALGWKEMSDSNVLEKLDITQMGRWYFVGWRNQPLATEAILGNSSNLHLIPQDDLIAKVVGQLRVGDLIHLKGYLVRVDARDGGEWRSSTTRSDKNNGACEVMYVRSIDVL